MKPFSRRKDTEVDRAREALTVLVAAFAARIDEQTGQTAALRAEVASLRTEVGKLPGQVAWADRYLADSDDRGPELLMKLATEVASFKFSHPDEYGAALASIVESADV